MRRICAFAPAVGPTGAPALAATHNPHPREGRTARPDRRSAQNRTAQRATGGQIDACGAAVLVLPS
jgi:hypothetical protein